MFHDLIPAPCFRGFRRAPSDPPPDTLAIAALDADRLAAYAEGHLNGLPANLPALRSKVQGLAIRVDDAMPDTDERFADVQSAVRICRIASQDAWISGIAPGSIGSTDAVTTRICALADALGNLHVVLDEASTAAGAR